MKNALIATIVFVITAFSSITIADDPVSYTHLTLPTKLEV